jgi:hypothetical protein
MNEERKIIGLSVRRKDTSPEFVLSSVSFEVDKFKKWLDENKNDKGWVNLDLKKTKDGNYYLDYYKPKASVPF